MWVVVGLGNPGPEYEHTRHNAGFMVVDALARRWGIPLEIDADGRARRGRGAYAGQPVSLLEPLVFMNRSGEVLEAVTPTDHVIAIYDDLDLPAGRLRIRLRGGAAGHRGVASLIERLGDEFSRLRIGVGRPPLGVEAADYVLAPLAPEDRRELNEVAERACDAIETLITEGPAMAMSRFNAAPASPADPC
jgi:PTH1 family peptidyl-tRNA hydrolase